MTERVRFGAQEKAGQFPMDRFVLPAVILVVLRKMAPVPICPSAIDLVQPVAARTERDGKGKHETECTGHLLFYKGCLSFAAEACPLAIFFTLAPQAWCSA